jgi:hypothetical protein
MMGITSNIVMYVLSITSGINYAGKETGFILEARNTKASK